MSSGAFPKSEVSVAACVIMALVVWLWTLARNQADLYQMVDVMGDNNVDTRRLAPISVATAGLKTMENPPEPQDTNADRYTSGHTQDTMLRGNSRKSGKGSPKPYCSNSVFRDYVSSNGYFPQGGYWEKRSGQLYQFHPAACEFRANISASSVKRCFKSAGIRSVVVVGDSHAGYYHRHLGTIFYTAMPNSTKLFSERLSYKLNATAVTSKALKCSSCINVAFRYRDDSGYTLFLERVGGMAIFIPVSYVLTAEEIRKENAGNMGYTEYLFKRHFKRNGFPDLLILAPPFHHTIRQANLTVANRQIAYYYRLVKASIPDTTRVYWITAISMFDDRKKIEWRNKTYEGMKANTKLNILNHLLFKRLQADIINNDTSMFGFLDLLDASKSLHDWSTDGVHLEQIWYELIDNYLLQVICANYLLDEEGN